ncbi:MAG: LysR family transcriptional regulator [Gammaproteobacteria bacterium]|nr:MAG: LysR family transcriptional regulator [Pseudomonadota bacterium]PIE38019.1 MAG: LysR family transcriptional regulator [Gammaproteobacteria bacterium]
MDTDYLTAFISVVENQSFSLAGEQLHLTQPAISKRIQTLEKLLDVQLFDRSQKKLQLTDAGRQLVNPARNVLSELQNLKLTIQNLEAEVSGELKITCSHHIGLHRLPPVLKRFTRQAPHVNLKFSFAESEKAYRELRNNQTDLAFITIEDDCGPDFTAHLSLDDPMSLVCAHSHPLAGLAQPEFDDIACHSAILPDEGTYLFKRVHQLFRERNRPLQANMPTNYLETIKMMVHAGLGWSVLPNLMIDETLYVLNVRDVKIHRNLGMATLTNRVMSRASSAFIASAREIWG